MGFLNLTSSILLVLYAVISIKAADPVQEKQDIQPKLSTLAISASASFSSSDILGVKIFNGQKTIVALEFTNSEVEPITISSIKGVLSSLNPLSVGVHPSASIIRNLTATRYNTAVPAGGKQTLPYAFTTDLHPQDLHMDIVATISSKDNNKQQFQAFNQTVTIVDPVASIFDPQILFLYMILLLITGATLYLTFKNWIQPLFPQAKRGTKGGERVKRSSPPIKNYNSPVEDDTSALDSNGSVSTSVLPGQKSYDESWIPEHHIKKTASKRVKGGSNKKIL